MVPDSIRQRPFSLQEVVARSIYGCLGLAALAALPLVVPAACLRERWRRGISERLTLRLPATPGDGRCLWLHAASVGEVLALSPLIDSLAESWPDLRMVLSTQTRAGRGIAINQLAGVETVFYFPLDLPGLAGRVLDRLNPSLVLITETEIWPGLLFAAARRAIPTVMVSGRVSPKAFLWYRRAKVVFAPALGLLSRVCVQSSADGDRLVMLGAERDRVRVTGSLKRVPAARATGEADWLEVMAGGGRPVFVAGSTHESEEEAVLAAFARARTEVPAALLVLAPRHPERFPDVAGIIERSGLPYASRSGMAMLAQDGNGAAAQPAVVLLDTIGELAACYRLATVAFVGGSLVDIGGHNLFEPASCRCPVLFGPHTGNSDEAARLLMAAGGGGRVGGPEDLARWLVDLMGNRARARAMGERGFAALAGNTDPVLLTTREISSFLGRSR